MVDATVDVIHRGGLECDQNYMIEGETLGTHDEPNPDVTYDEIPVWSLVIDHPEATILWDTGSHHDALDGHWPEGSYRRFIPTTPTNIGSTTISEAGYSLDDIDAVFQTHLHLDHAGGLEFSTGPTSRSTSTNARSSSPTTARRRTREARRTSSKTSITT
ncbi:MBL fold metallo-hydrolase [Natrialba swarupiae]|nr:MBL fold metallo-hydrolase [Natrialba swarupiae]